MITKRIKDFLKNEKGGVSKKALLQGAVASGIAFTLAHTVLGSSNDYNYMTHSNNLELRYDDTAGARGTHINHGNHHNHSEY